MSHEELAAPHGNACHHVRRMSVRALVCIVTFMALGLLTAMAFSAFTQPKTAKASLRPSLPPTTFPPSFGVQRIGRSELLASGETILGPTQLVAFWSTSGLCVELDHLNFQSRAGGCGFKALPPSRQVLAVGAGYTGTPGEIGLTEILGQANPSTRSVLIEYHYANTRHRVRAMVGGLPARMRKDNGPSSAMWFGANLRGCVGGSSVKIRVFGPHKRFLGEDQGITQGAACRAGAGYKVRGSVTFGSLPSL